MKKVEHVEAILYHKIQDSDFTNMYGVKKPIGGGGQTYIQAAGYTQHELDKMFREAHAVNTPEYWDVEKIYPRKKYTISAQVVGGAECAEIELAPRTGRIDYRISRQNLKYRHPAWSQKNDFPAPEKDKDNNYIYEKNYPGKIDCLYIMIIKTRTEECSVHYYANYIISKSIPESWPNSVGLEIIFSGKRQGIIFYNEQFLRFNNDKIKMFTPGSAIDAEIDNILLPNNLTECVDDAIEYSTRDVNISINYSDVEFVQVEAPVIKFRTNAINSGEAVKDKDYIRRQKNLKKIGDLGEALVLQMEKVRLINAGREDLADKINHVSKSIGDGLGYDIQSYELIDKDYVEKYIEVKSTTGGKNKPFDISANEVEVSADKKDKYVVIRLFGIQSNLKEIRYYEARGSIKESFNLVPTTFKAYSK